MTYKTNTEIFYEAALSLQLKPTPVVVNDTVNLSRFGFYVEGNGKKCYISTKSFFPNVHRWQLALMSDKLITSAVLEQNNFSTIQSVVFTKQQSITLSDLEKKVLRIPLPILIKPNHGHDGAGIELCDERARTSAVIAAYYAENVSFLAQPFIVQPEYRIMVVNKEIMFIHRKKFPEVIGDGKTTLAELLKKARYVDTSTIQKECLKLNLSQHSIIPLGQKIKTHITKKSDPAYYKTSQFPIPLIHWVKDVCDALNIETVGLDVFGGDDIGDTEKLIIIELNSKPSLCYLSTYYKDKETPLRTAKKILAHYFDVATL